MKHRPRVSIGLPVRNGAPQLRATLDSLLAQTFGDFELIISDNVSGDETDTICREYARRDDRIRYFRTKANLGAAANYNRVFDFARGQYFKWATHIDLYAPTYLQRCVDALDGDLSAVLVQARTAVIDDAAQRVATFEARQTPFDHTPNARARGELYDRNGRRLDSTVGPERFHDLLMRTQWCDELYGLIRRDVLERTQLHRPFDGAGKVLLTQLCLIGRFITVPEELFFRRLRAIDMPGGLNGMPRELLTRLRCAIACTRSIFREQIPLHERIECLMTTARWGMQISKWKQLLAHDPKPMQQTLPA